LERELFRFLREDLRYGNIHASAVIAFPIGKRFSRSVSFSPFEIPFGADLAHSFVDDALQLVQVSMGVMLPDVPHDSIKHGPTGVFFH
jgi:hypothetical protein